MIIKAHNFSIQCWSMNAEPCGRNLGEDKARVLRQFSSWSSSQMGIGTSILAWKIVVSAWHWWSIWSPWNSTGYVASLRLLMKLVWRLLVQETHGNCGADEGRGILYILVLNSCLHTYHGLGGERIVRRCMGRWYFWKAPSPRFVFWCYAKCRRGNMKYRTDEVEKWPEMLLEVFR